MKRSRNTYRKGTSSMLAKQTRDRKGWSLNQVLKFGCIFTKTIFKKQHLKLQPRGDGLLKVIAQINDNAYKLDFPSKYSINATFNVFDLSPFDAAHENLRMNPFVEWWEWCNNEGEPTRKRKATHHLLNVVQWCGME